MKVQTKDLIGQALDWAVDKAEGIPFENGNPIGSPSAVLAAWMRLHKAGQGHYSTDWSQGGPIIEQEIGNLYKQNKLTPSDPDVWTAIAYIKAPGGTALYYCDGPTPLIAAMRCYCCSKLGDIVDIPEELCQ